MWQNLRNRVILLKNKSIGSALEKSRTDANYTQAELARYLCCDAAEIDEWESGTVQPNIAQCLVLSKLYGVSLDDMFANFNVHEVLAEECVAPFERERMLNSAAKRWYN